MPVILFVIVVAILFLGPVFWLLVGPQAREESRNIQAAIDAFDEYYDSKE